MGFNSINFVSNTGTDFYFIFIYFFGLLMIGVLYPCEKQIFKSLREKLIENFRHAYILRLFIESYLSFGICFVL